MSEVLPAERHAALAVASRQRLLAVLRASGEPMDAASLADAVGLHLTTIRFHLEVLEEAGLVSRAAEREGRPGRPRQLYRLVDDQRALPSRPADPAMRYRELASVLVGALAVEPASTRRAEEAGRRWADSQVPHETLSWDEGTRRLVTVLNRLGFEPSLVDDDHGRHVEFAACPFRDLARAHPEVVCTVHRGLLRGLLSRLDVRGADEAGLRPFVEAELCVADLPGSGDQTRSGDRANSI